MIRREPVGVVGQISPWNYPLMMAIVEDRPGARHRQHGGAEAGESTPITTVKLAEYAGEVLPPGVLNVITGHGKPAGSSLVPTPDVGMVSLTGSPETGKWIASAAADSLKRVHLELGGKAPVIVFDDVDMDVAMETIAATGLYNAGQDCTAATRVLASSKVYDDVVNGLPTRPRATRPATRSTRHHARPLNSMTQREQEGSSRASPAPRS